MTSRVSGVGRVGDGDAAGRVEVVVVEVAGGFDGMDVVVDAADSTAARQAVSTEPKPTEPASSTSRRRRDRSMTSRYRERSQIEGAHCYPHDSSRRSACFSGGSSHLMVVSTTLVASPAVDAALW